MFRRGAQVFHLTRKGPLRQNLKKVPQIILFRRWQPVGIHGRAKNRTTPNGKEKDSLSHVSVEETGNGVGKIQEGEKKNRGRILSKEGGK